MTPYQLAQAIARERGFDPREDVFARVMGAIFEAWKRILCPRCGGLDSSTAGHTGSVCDKCLDQLQEEHDTQEEQWAARERDRMTREGY